MSLNPINPSQAIRQQQEKSQVCPSDKKAGHEKNSIVELFAVLKLNYPNQFMAKLGKEEIEVHMRLWHRHLQRFSAEQIGKASIDVIDNHPTYPPNVGEFKKLVAATRIRPAGLAIELSPICPNCRSVRHSQRHADECGGK